MKQTAYEQLKVLVDTSNYLVKDDVFKTLFNRAVESFNDKQRKSGNYDLVIPKAETYKNLGDLSDVRKILKQIETVNKRQYKLKEIEQKQREKYKVDKPKPKKTKKDNWENIDKALKKQLKQYEKERKKEYSEYLKGHFAKAYEKETGEKLSDRQYKVIGELFRAYRENNLTKSIASEQVYDLALGLIKKGMRKGEYQQLLKNITKNLNDFSEYNDFRQQIIDAFTVDKDLLPLAKPYNPGQKVVDVSESSEDLKGMFK